MEENDRHVLLGLSADETDELARLDPIINAVTQKQEGLAEAEQRWSELFGKYESRARI